MAGPSLWATPLSEAQFLALTSTLDWRAVPGAGATIVAAHAVGAAPGAPLGESAAAWAGGRWTDTGPHGTGAVLCRVVCMAYMKSGQADDALWCPNVSPPPPLCLSHGNFDVHIVTDAAHPM